jgi:hypothetical protein
MISFKTSSGSGTQLVEAIQFDGLSLEEFLEKEDSAPRKKTRECDVNAQFAHLRHIPGSFS